MTEMQLAPKVIKSDTKGRVVTPVERRESLLDEFEQSGLSGPKFAKVVGVKYSTLAAWAQRRRRERGQASRAKPPQAPPNSMRWLEAVVEKAELPASSAPSTLRVQLPSGVRLEIADAQQAALAAALLRAWEKAVPTC